MPVEIIDLTRHLSEKMGGKPVTVPIGNHGAPISVIDGQLFVFWRVRFEYAISVRPLEIVYKDSRPAQVPPKAIMDRHLVFNCRKIEESRKYTFSSSWTETTSVTRSQTYVTGSSTTIKADGGFNLPIARASAGISVTHNESYTKTATDSIVHTETKSETYPYEEKVAPQTYRWIKFERSLGNNETPFHGTFLLTGDIRVVFFSPKNGKIATVFARPLEEYISERDRTVPADGFITNITAGKLVFGSTPDRSIDEKPELCQAPERLTFAVLRNAFSSVMSSVSADVRVIQTFELPEGQWQAVFAVDVENCDQSYCGAFDATLLFDDATEFVTSVDGWSTGESSGGHFQIIRGGSVGGNQKIVSVDVTYPVQALCQID